MRLAVVALCIATGMAAGVPQPTQYLAPPPPAATATSAPFAIPTTVNGAPVRDCTVNVPAAGLYWWYGTNYTVDTARYQGVFDQDETHITAYSSITYLGVTSTYNVTSLVHRPSSTPYITTIPAFTITGFSTFTRRTYTAYSAVNTSAPSAPSTTVLELHDHKSAPSVFPASQLTDYSIRLGPAQTAIDTFTATSSTPFVRYHSYEVAYPQSTVTVSLASDYAYGIPAVDFNGVSSTSGPVPTDFVRSIPENNCVAGTWFAKPTVIIVVIETWALVAVKAAHVEVSQASLDIPKPLATPSAGGGSNGPSSGSASSNNNAYPSGQSDANNLPLVQASTNKGAATDGTATADTGPSLAGSGSSSGVPTPDTNSGSGGQQSAEQSSGQSAGGSSSGQSTGSPSSSQSASSSSSDQSAGSPSSGSQSSGQSAGIPSSGSQSSGSQSSGAQSNNNQSSNKQSSDNQRPNNQQPNQLTNPSSTRPTTPSTNPSPTSSSAAPTTLPLRALVWAALFASAWHLF